MKKTDVLIIGSGVAGLSFALNMAKSHPNISITVLAKANAEETNTRYAQGGIAVVMNQTEDDFEQHIQDTLKSGGGLCNREVVEMVIRQAPERVQEIINMGASFDKDQSGTYNLGLEGGHSQNRILHHKDTTGLEVEKTLLQAVKQFPNIIIDQHFAVIDLIVEKKNTIKTCIGAYCLNLTTNTINTIKAKVIMVCTGGAGQLFKNTTNPNIATGDGVAIAGRVGAKIADMNFFQFHPTALYEPDRNPAFLISEAVRGFGAYVLNHQNRRFLFDYDARGELATRDIVSQAINSELELSGKDFVFLYCRHLKDKGFESHFPSITRYCKTIGLNPIIDLLPIVPAAHYQCGGIVVNTNAETSIANLFANGECARTGLHGSNRLASNSLLEALVFSFQAGVEVSNRISKLNFSDHQDTSFYHYGEVNRIEIDDLKKRLKSVMNRFYFNQDVSKTTVLASITELKEEVLANYTMHTVSAPLMELKNMLEVAQLIISQS